MEGVQIGNLQIPIAKGDKGDTGAAGKISSLTITMLGTTATPTVTNSGTVYDAQYTLGIPRGTGVSSVVINESGQLVITLTDGTVTNLGVVNGTSITNVEIDDDYNLIVTLSDETEINAGNLEDEISDIIEGYLADYYDKDTADSMFALITETGNKIDLSINSSTYVLSLALKDKNNNTLSTGSVDLPLESVVVSGSYDAVNKKIVLTLQNGSTVEFSVADLVAGLQSEITANNKLDADLVDDTNSTNKFVTSAEKTKISNAVTFSDYATGSKSGVFMLGDGIYLQSSRLRASALSTEQITDGQHNSYITGVGSVINAIKTRISSSVSSSSTNEYAVGAKLFYDTIGDIDSALDAINGEVI